MVANKKWQPCSVCGELRSISHSSASVIICRKCRVASVEHGTRTMYGRGCRCEPCRMVNRDYDIARSKIPCLVCGELRWPTSFKEENGPCLKCRIGQRPKPKNYPANYNCVNCGIMVNRKYANGNRGMWCRDCARRGYRMRVCKVCGETKPMTGETCTYCYRNVVQHWRTKELVLFTGERINSKLIETKIEIPRIWVSGPCNWCGENFISSRLSTRYCSRKCKLRASSANHRNFPISSKLRQEIYVRDKWKCWICKRRVDPTLDSRDSMGATLDHVVAQANLLIPDHHPNNLRLAHRICNSRKGTKSVPHRRRKTWAT